MDENYNQDEQVHDQQLPQPSDQNYYNQHQEQPSFQSTPPPPYPPPSQPPPPGPPLYEQRNQNEPQHQPPQFQLQYNQNQEQPSFQSTPPPPYQPPSQPPPPGPPLYQQHNQNKPQHQPPQFQLQYNQNPPQMVQPTMLSPRPGGGYPPNQQNVGTEGWNTELFGCLEDPQNAIITAFFPCVTFGQIAEIIDNGHSSCTTQGVLYSAALCCIGMPCLVSCSYRTKLRSRYQLMETPAPDWFTHCFCEPCALCQEYRELRHRGVDPSIGWQGNLSLQERNYAMTPPANHGMMHK